MLRLGLKASGIDPQQATLLPAGPPNARIAALASGQMDATIVLPENLGAVEKAGLKVLKDLSEVDLQIQHTGLVVRRSLIKENRNLVKSVLAAIVEAINFYRGNERETIEIMGAFAGTRDARPLLDSYRFHKRLFQQSNSLIGRYWTNSKQNKDRGLSKTYSFESDQHERIYIPF